MDVNEYLSSDAILPQIDASDKWQVIDRLLDTLMETPLLQEHADLDRDTIRNAIIDRERQHPTGIGHGLAMPHARLENFSGLGLAFATLKTPVSFEAPDNEPAWFVVLMLLPEAHATVGLRLTAELARNMQNAELRETLHAETDPHTLREILADRVLAGDVAVKARDIMQPVKGRLYPDMTVRQVTRTIMALNLIAAPVVDTENTLLGQITCDDLFRLGMPSFFNQLKTVSFIRNFDPFDRYFEGENQRHARDVMTQNYAALGEDATLIEIVFELAVRRHPRVYIVRENRLVGVVDHNVVLDRVINF